MSVEKITSIILYDQTLCHKNYGMKTCVSFDQNAAKRSSTKRTLFERV